MKVVLDPRRDVRRVARGLHQASWLRDVDWSHKNLAHDRREWMGQARRLLDALAAQCMSYAGKGDK